MAEMRETLQLDQDEWQIGLYELHADKFTDQPLFMTFAPWDRELEQGIRRLANGESVREFTLATKAGTWTGKARLYQTDSMRHPFRIEFLKGQIILK